MSGFVFVRLFIVVSVKFINWLFGVCFPLLKQLFCLQMFLEAVFDFKYGSKFQNKTQTPLQY